MFTLTLNLTRKIGLVLLEEDYPEGSRNVMPLGDKSTNYIL